MKKTSLFLAALFLSLSSLFAQMADPNAPLTMDPAVRIGKLDNGLTYYIRHNEKPAQRAEFYLYTDVGAIQENERQAGLAHFLEHMCLNGSKNFPGNSIISYLESIGCTFGENINASTGVEQTNYMLNNIPVVREGIIDSCLLIIHDYAAFVTLDPKDIDAERPIIIEELRTRRNAQWRIMEQSFPHLFKGSKYATCNIIGTVEWLQQFEPKDIQDFYHTWYRPDHQAVVVVGDVDVDQIENKIKTLFSDIPAPTTPSPKVVYTIPDNEEPIVGICTDPEAQTSSVEVYFKSEIFPREMRPLGVNYLTDLMKVLIQMMFNERLTEISQQPDAPFLGAGTGFTAISKSCDAFVMQAAYKDGTFDIAFNALMEEMERLKRFGFSDAELERAKTNVQRQLQSSVENAADRKNAEFIHSIIEHFSDNEPILDPAYELQVYNGYMPLITSTIINQVIAQVPTENNRVVLVSGPQREGLAYPDKNQIVNIMDNMEEAQLEARSEDMPTEPLVDESRITPGTVLTTESGPYNSTILTLSNGVKVIVKPTDYKKDEVIVRAWMEGGRSVLPEELIPSVEQNVWTLWTNSQGIGAYSSTQLSKWLTGKLVSLNTFLESTQHGFSGKSSPQDLETFFQLLYADVLTPRYEKAEYDAAMAQLFALIPNLVKNPAFEFRNHLFQNMRENSYRHQGLTLEKLEQISFDNTVAAQKQLFSAVDGLTLYVVGNTNIETLKPLLEKYVATLPTSGTLRTWKDNGDILRKGHVEDHFTFPMETAKTTICQLRNFPIEPTLENDILLSAYEYILNMTYTETLREDEGGTYGASVQCATVNRPQKEAILLIYMDTDPTRYAKMREITAQGIAAMAADGPKEEDVNKTRESFLKSFEEKQISNGYWMGCLKDYMDEGMDRYTEYAQTVQKVLTAQNIQKIAKAFAETENYTDIMMNPEE